MENEIFSNDPLGNLPRNTARIVISHELLGPETHRFESFAEATKEVNVALSAMGSDPVYVYPDVYGYVWAKNVYGEGVPFEIGYEE